MLYFLTKYRYFEKVKKTFDIILRIAEICTVWLLQGYGDTFRFSGRANDTTTFDVSKRRQAFSLSAFLHF